VHGENLKLTDMQIYRTVIFPLCFVCNWNLVSRTNGRT